MQNGATIIVTGGAGFIGSALVRRLIERTQARVVNIDKLTYAGNLSSVASVADHDRYAFEQVDICDQTAVARLFEQYEPRAIVHLAAETHVDRSINDPGPFISTNLIGTYTLLEAATAYWTKSESKMKNAFRFLHVSTDEVYGSLGPSGAFTEQSPYDPSSPYAATKAGADHLVRAWQRTYGLPIMITNSTNNFGPCQHREKLIPVVIASALSGREIPIFGDGGHIRDWLYVGDHASALRHVLNEGKVGETYAIGGGNERTNLQIASSICGTLDNRLPNSQHAPHGTLISNVEDRPGHDRRYAIDTSKIRTALGWEPEEPFDSALAKTVDWYLANREWLSEAH